MATESEARTGVGDWLLIAASLASLTVAVLNDVTPGNGIAGSDGALLVAVSSALVLTAALILAFALPRRTWQRVTLEILLAVGITATGFAAYLLEANLHLGFIALAFVGWVAHLFGPPRAADRSTPARPSVA